MRVLLTRGTMLSLSLGALGAPSSTFLESVPKCPLKVSQSVPPSWWHETACSGLRYEV